MAQKKGGFFSGISAAVDGLAGSIDRAAKSVTTDIANTVNPLVYFTSSNVVMITSRTTLKCLSVDNYGVISCNVAPLQISNASAHFQVVPSTTTAVAYKLRSMAYPNFYLGIYNGNLIGNALGGPECDFYGRVTPATSSVEISEYMSLQSVMYQGSHIGVLKTGQVTVPAQTSPAASHTAHFKLKYIKQAKLPVLPSPPVPQQQQQQPGQQQPPLQQLPPPGQPGYSPSTPPMQRQGLPPGTDQGAQYPPPSAPPPYEAAQYQPPQQYPPGMEKKPL